MSKPKKTQVDTLHAVIDAIMRRFKIAESKMPPDKALNQIDMQTILYISSHPYCGLTDIARYLRVVPTTMSSATDRLVKQGLVSRERPENSDRRAIALSLTKPGKAYANELTTAQKEHCELMLRSLSGEERDQFIVLITKIALNDT